MIEYSKVNAKLTDTQLIKLWTAVKNKRRTTLRIGSKMLDKNDLPHELHHDNKTKNKANKCI